MADIADYSPRSGIMIGADNRAYNIVDLIGGGAPVNDQIYDITKYPPFGGIVIGNDGRAYDLAKLIREKAVTAYQIAVAGGFEGTEAEWLQSIMGVEGKSAYQVAVDAGFTGTAAEWLVSLTGPQGKSAYQVAADAGFTGTAAEWLASLTGPQGKSAYQVAVDAGFTGTAAEWLLSLIGPQGQSAYQVAVAGGYEGTRAEWLLSLIGPQGQSAYQVAVTGGYGGTAAEWLASLVGAQGPSAYQVAVANGFEGTQAEWLASLVGPSGGIDQYAAMPAVTENMVGDIAQFTGATGTYTFGHFYAAVSDGGTPPTYTWEEIVFGTANSLQMVLAWTNPSPASAFAAQTVAVDLSDADMIGIIYLYSTGGGQLPLDMYTKGANRLKYATTNANMFRYATTLSDTGIAFADAYYVATYGANGAVNNTYLIPYAIYKIRNVL